MTAVIAPAARSSRVSLSWLAEQGMGASILVAALSSAFGVVLIEATVYIGRMLQANPYIGGTDTFAVIVVILSVLLVGVALYVASIVTANTFATIVAGRTRRIALFRLVGATARSQRRVLARQGLGVGVIGAVLGALVGLLIAVIGVRIMGDVFEDGTVFSVLQPAAILPAAAVVLTTWAAAWAGSRRVLAVTPLQAIAGSVERGREEIARHSGRRVSALVLGILGIVFLALGVVAGLYTPLAVLISFVGGLLSFTGLAIGASSIMPPILRLVGRLLGSSAPARLAAENALRYPERSSRMAIGVVMGVTLVTMFAVALESVKVLLVAAADGNVPQEMLTTIDAFSAVMMTIVAISAVIAGVGLVNLLTIGVVQRRRELGLLHAIGLSNRQLRRMILLEAVHITVAATTTGLLLGIAYGWVAAQSVLGSVAIVEGVGPAGLVATQVPRIPVAVIIAGTAILTLLAAATPTRLATRVPPVEALAAD